MHLLKSRFFQTIAGHFGSRMSDVGRIVKTHYSFEEWLNWEAYLACLSCDFDRVAPKPAYSSCGAKSCGSYFGDLLIEDRGNVLLAEIGVVHDGTGDKWLAKLEHDRKKLLQEFSAGVAPIQLIVCASSVDLRSDAKWTKWLANLTFWSTPSWGDAVVDLTPGKLQLRAWDCVKSLPV